MSIQAVIFDMDGTLIDSEPLWQRASYEYFKACGYPVTQEEIWHLSGVPVRGHAEYMLRHYGDKGLSVEALSAGFEARAVKMILEQKPLIAGVPETLEALKKRGIKMAIASASPLYMLQEIVESCGIAQYFDYLSSAVGLPYNKPHPAVYLQAAEKLNVAPQDCLAVEDSITGMTAAKAAAMSCAVIPPKENANKPQWSLANYQLATISEVADLPMD